MTFPLTTLGPTVSSTGISIPPYADIYQSLQASFQSIYGTDAYIDPDSQDGQLLAIVARALYDTNSTAVAIYNAYSPATAQGVALGNQVKINGIKRGIPTNSQVLVTITGQVGATILAGRVGDTAGFQWDLPATVTIPGAGFIDVTATCTTPGAIEAAVGAVTTIVTPTLGWQSVTNASEASTGAPVESDASLRVRQTSSVALPSQTVLDGLVGAVESLEGVTQVKAYENDTDTTDADGLPEHSIALIVRGGDSDAIAHAILFKKTPGCYTYGTTVVTPVIDSHGVVYTIRYFIPTEIAIMVEVTIHNLTGYLSEIGDAIKQAVADYINALSIGQDVFISRLFLPAQFFGAAGSETFELQTIEIAISPGPVAGADVTIAFNERATCDIGDIVVTIV